MSHRICFYTDDSYMSCGKKLVHAVIAGAAIAFDRTNVRRALLDAERKSGKRLSDWSHTHPQSVRERYLEAVFDIQSLRGRIFFQAFDVLRNDQKWPAMVDTLHSAINQFTPGRCHHQVFHEGLQSNPRHQLRTDLKNRGCERVTVEPGQFHGDPEMRLADAIAGYVRGELYRGDGERAILTNLPNWLVDLNPPEKRNPPALTGG